MKKRKKRTKKRTKDRFFCTQIRRCPSGAEIFLFHSHSHSHSDSLLIVPPFSTGAFFFQWRKRKRSRFSSKFGTLKAHWWDSSFIFYSFSIPFSIRFYGRASRDSNIFQIKRLKIFENSFRVFTRWIFITNSFCLFFFWIFQFHF